MYHVHAFVDAHETKLITNFLLNFGNFTTSLLDKKKKQHHKCISVYINKSVTQMRKRKLF